jgi:AmmeMemoRadiSam system protein A
MDFTIDSDEREILLSQARESITADLEGRKPVYSESPTREDSALNKPCGAFVTLHSGNTGRRSLRGCIGRMTATQPLIETVRLMAKEAAFGDPRFPPIRHEELKLCQIEISALSPMTPCENPRNIKIGIHGLYLTRGGRSGVLLPQVPIEQAWNLDEYLEYICIKAGVPPKSWEAPDAQLLTFTAIVFGEE